MRQTVGQRRHLKLKNHQNISSVCPWCVDCVSNLRLVSACQTFPTPPCTTRRARSASTSPSEPGGMDEMDEIWHVSLWLSTRSAFGRYHQIFIRSHIGSYRISSDQNIDFLSIDVPIIFESFIEILRSQKKKQRAALMISNAGNIRFGSRCSSWGNTSGFRASRGDDIWPAICQVAMICGWSQHTLGIAWLYNI